MSTWKAKETLLIVGEGYSEVAFLNHVKQLFSERVDGRQIKIKNAKGKGAKHVIDWTIRQTFNADYDRVAVVFDTDTTCWNSDVRKKAEKNSITLLASEPCFEAMLLRVLGKSDSGVASALKKRFALYVNNDSTVMENYGKFFPKKILMESTEKSIQNLLKLVKK
ncbi:MAG: hypothetical protein A3E82_08390 [Gammaproteobacteria bacterium RIFCSPHIGHO2_12_FULL_38_11]|nr:MAG: hypothetical protein A3E82_08390 [Gammaproteobacteria bacterium RIFCSPHIGHO2_12_FULL_38_11]